jgi:hypothetical protein
MQNDKGANVDLYIPRKWCVARPRARARAYEPVLAACLDAARPPCPAAAARRAGLAAAGLALAALARMRQGCRGARGAALSARGGGRGAATATSRSLSGDLTRTCWRGAGAGAGAGGSAGDAAAPSDLFRRSASPCAGRPHSARPLLPRHVLVLTLALCSLCAPRAARGRSA